MVARIYSEPELNELVEKKTLIERYRKSQKSVFKFCLDERVNPSKLYRLLEKVQSGDTALLDRRRGNRGRRSKVDDRVLSYLIAAQAEYPRAPMTSLYHQLCEVAAKENWVLPSYGHLCRVIHSLAPDIRSFLEEGSKAHFEQWGLKSIRQIPLINSLWQIDATHLPLWVLDPESGQLIQPWMISLIDGASRVVVSARVFKTTPNTGDVLLCLREAILPKDNPGMPWLGKPLAVSADHGSIFKSADFLDALLRLQIEFQPIEKDCPSQNGKIERWFGTLQKSFLSVMPGYADQHRGLERAGHAAFPWPVLQRQVDKVLNHYHSRDHGVLQTSPWEYYREHQGAAAGLSFTAAEVIEACKVRQECMVHALGVQLPDKRWFTSPSLTGLSRKNITLRLLPEGGDREVEAFYQGHCLGTLKPSDSPGIAEALKTARLERLKELQALRKQLRKAAQEYLPSETVKSASQTPAASGQEASAESPIEEIQDLKEEDEI